MSEKHRRGLSLSVEGHDEYDHFNIPERRLLRAILERWVLDLFLYKKGPGRTEGKMLRQYHNPLKYIRDKTDREWSLNWVLSQLFNNPADIRKKLERLVKDIMSGKKLDNLLGIVNKDYAEYNYSDTSISILDGNTGDSLLHFAKSGKTTIH